MAVSNHWKLDDNDAASTTVVATVGSNGTLRGGDNTSDKAAAGPGGSITASFLLNGTDDDVAISGADLAINVAASFDCWFKISSLVTNMGVLGNNASSVHSVRITTDTSISIRSSPGSSQTFTVPSLGTGWHHLLLTKTSGNSWRLFIDAVESSTGAIASAGSITPPNIGVGSATGQWFNGNIANARFHDTDESANAATWYAEGGAAPEITYNGGAPATINVEEGVTAVDTITATGSGITWTKSGTDSSFFSIDSSSGVLTFATARDYETPADANGDNDYLVTVTATNGSGADTIDLTVRVTDYPTTRVSLMRHAIRTSNGAENYTISGLGIAQRIKAAFRFGGYGTANGTAADGAFFGYGLSVPSSTNRSVHSRMEHGATTDVEGHVSLNYWAKVTASNALQYLSALTGFTTDGLSVSVNPAPPSAILDHILFFAGDDIQAEIVEGFTADQGSSIDIALGFTPTLLIMIQSDDGWDGSPSHLGFAPHTITFVSRSAAGTVETASMAVAGIHLDSGTTDCYGTVSTKSVYWDPVRSVAGPEFEYSLTFPDSTTLRITTDVKRGIDNNQDVAILALKFGTRATQVGIATMGTGTGSQELNLLPSPAFTPETFVCLPSRITSVDTDRIASAEAGVAGVAAVTRPSGFSAGNGEFCSTVAWEQGASTTNTQSLTDNQLIAIPEDDGTGLIEASFVSFAAGTVNINVTAAPGTAIKMPYFAVSDGSAGSYSETAGAGAGAGAGQTGTITVGTDFSAAAGAGAGSGAGHVATLTVGTDVSLTAGVGAGTGTGHAATLAVGTDVTLTAGAGSGSGTGHTAELTTSGAITLTAGVGSGSGSGYAATLTAGTDFSVTLGAGSGTGAGKLATVTTSPATSSGRSRPRLFLSGGLIA